MSTIFISPPAFLPSILLNLVISLDKLYDILSFSEVCIGTEGFLLKEPNFPLGFLRCIPVISGVIPAASFNSSGVDGRTTCLSLMFSTSFTTSLFLRTRNPNLSALKLLYISKLLNFGCDSINELSSFRSSFISGTPKLSFSFSYFLSNSLNLSSLEESLAILYTGVSVVISSLTVSVFTSAGLFFLFALSNSLSFLDSVGLDCLETVEEYLPRFNNILPTDTPSWNT